MNRWQQINEKYKQITLREKLMLMASGLVVVLFGGYTGLIEPTLIQTEKLEKSYQTKVQGLASLNLRIDELNALLKQDPNAPLLAKQNSLNSSMKSVDEKLRDQTVDLIPANRMSEVLERILEKTRQVEVVNLQALPPRRMIDASDSESQQKVNLFQHGLRVELRGRYFDLLRYLESVEGLSWQFYWKNFDYQVAEYPEGSLTIEIYTLSTNEEFIGV